MIRISQLFFYKRKTKKKYERNYKYTKHPNRINSQQIRPRNNFFIIIFVREEKKNIHGFKYMKYIFLLILQFLQ